MCPLRIILIFLSATLAGFFVLRNIKAQRDDENDDVREDVDFSDDASLSSKVFSAVGNGFWVFVDMASGKYLWRNLVSPSSTEKLRSD